MRREQFYDRLRNWMRRGGAGGFVAALVIASAALASDNPGEPREFAALFLFCAVAGALGGGMLFIKYTSFAELRESVGVARSMTLMAALYVGVVAALVAAKYISDW